MGGATDAEIEIRDACKSDVGVLNAMATEEGMEEIPSADGVRVAVDSRGNIIAFVRLLWGCNGFAHVNPIITSAACRGHGVGRMLVADAFERFGELRLVSRGPSIGFYRALGFEDIPWSDVDVAVGHDCTGCPIKGECMPNPMRLTHFPA